MEENANKLHFKCIDYNSSTRVTVCAKCIYVSLIKILSSSLNTMLIVDKHCSDVCCDKFPMPQSDRKSKQEKEQWHENFICNQCGGKLAIINIEKIKICGWITTLEAIKMQFVCILSISAEYLQKIRSGYKFVYRRDMSRFNTRTSR